MYGVAVIQLQYAAMYAQYAAASRHKKPSTISAIRGARRDEVGEVVTALPEPSCKRMGG